MSADRPPEHRPPEGRPSDLARAALAAARQAARGRQRPARAGRGQAGADRTGRSSRRPDAGGLSGPGPDARDPQPFGALIDRLVSDRGWERAAADASVTGRWDVLVGEDIAGHCHPVSLRAGELTVAAESTAWATQLRLLAPRIVATLTSQLGPGVVTRVRVHGPTAPSWRKGQRHVAGRGPRDTYG